MAQLGTTRTELKLLFHRMKAEKEALDTSDLMLQLANLGEEMNNPFPYNRQADSHELYSFLTECSYTDVDGCPSFLNPLLGRGEQFFVCTSCEFEHNNPYDFTTQFIENSSTKDEIHLAEVISLYDQIENHDLDCVNCKERVLHTKSMHIYFLPTNFFICVKRWQRTPKGKVNKLKYALNFTEELEIKPAPLASVSQYHLKGFITHFGTINKGHYVTYIKMTHSWYLIDDSKVSPVCLNDVFSQENKTNVYILLYDAVQKKNIFGGSSREAHASLNLTDTEIQLTKEYLKVCDSVNQQFYCLQFLFTLIIPDKVFKNTLTVAPSKFMTIEG